MDKKQTAIGIYLLTMFALATRTTQNDTYKEIALSNEAELKQTMSIDFKGKNKVFDLTKKDYDSDVSAEVIPIPLTDSDGVDHTSYALHIFPTYLSKETEGSKTVRGVYSSIGNLTLHNQIISLEGQSIRKILDEQIHQQTKNTGENSVLMISNTLQLSLNLFLTNTLYAEDSRCISTFYLIDVLDEEKIQLYTLTRTYENWNPANQKAIEMDFDKLKHCLFSDDKKIFDCAILDSLIGKLAEHYIYK